MDQESTHQFEARKSDHIRASMDPRSQSLGTGFDRLHFAHEALPEIDFSDVSIATSIFPNAFLNSETESAPFFASSMTAGHSGSVALNERLARACEAKQWIMGVGSQRRELGDVSAAREWSEIRKSCRKVRLMGNLGLSQLIEVMREDSSAVQRLVDSLQAEAMIVHLNPLQEAVQPEGTPRFRGGLAAIEALVRALGRTPVIVKETGCGISAVTAKRLLEAGVAVIDVAGRGGTHWGRIEGLRMGAWAEGFKDTSEQAVKRETSQTMKDWGLSTVESLRQVVGVSKVAQTGGPVVWASGGIRSGLDAAKALYLGARAVG
ncbi:MAG: alpha-hydroxy-acid oxidizing protein, partial [Bdellovibrionales bacterium]|nr:alpha-hydroxy-acid oxidizing protein [Bdellovibrionales bacterium]